MDERSATPPRDKPGSAAATNQAVLLARCLPGHSTWPGRSAISPRVLQSFIGSRIFLYISLRGNLGTIWIFRTCTKGKAEVYIICMLNNVTVAASTILDDEMSIHKQHTLWNDFHPVRIIAGKTRVLRLIADYVGILQAKERLCDLYYYNMKYIVSLRHGMIFIASTTFLIICGRTCRHHSARRSTSSLQTIHTG